MRPTTLQLSSVLLGASLLTVSVEAQAFCILPTRHPFPQGPFGTYQAVPVYSQELWALFIGSGTEAEGVAALKIAIDLINSSGTNAPRLYYAGAATGIFPYAAAGWPDQLEGDAGGILVQTTPCTDYAASNLGNALGVEKGGNATRTKIVLRRGAAACEGFPGGGETHWYVDPDGDGGSFDDSDGPSDVVGVMTHELLHALGLGHNNDILDGMNCSNLHPRTVAVNSFMYAGNTYSRLWRKRLKRDDIEGLRYIYGDAARTPQYTQSIAGTAPNSASWSASTDVLAGLQINTPMSLSDATRSIDEVQLAGFTDTEDEVRFLTGDWTDWSGNPAGGTAVPSPIPPNGPLHSWERVVVARGVPAAQTSLAFSRELFAWVGGDSRGTDEDINNLEVGIHFRVRKEGTWVTQAIPAQTKYRSLGASYDPRLDVFVLAYIDTCTLSPGPACAATTDIPSGATVFVRTISATTGAALSTQAITSADDPHAIGDVSCDFISTIRNTLCKIPIASSNNGGPSLRILEGNIGLTSGVPAFALSSILQPALISVGAPSSAMNASPENGSMLVGYTPTFSTLVPASDGYARIFTMDRTASAVLDGGVDNSWTFQTWFWPLHVGTMNQAMITDPKWRAITY